MSNALKRVMDIRREEWPLALLMFGYFFLVITSFWILKPIKKSLFIGFYQADGFRLADWAMTAAQAELLAKVLNMGVALVAVTVFSFLARRWHRQQLTAIFSVFFMICYGLYSLTINHPGDLQVWSFYLFGDLFSTLMVATFFAFLNDSVTSDRAKRLYGLVGMGGVTGGAFGSTFVRVWIDEIPRSGWLLICLGIAAVIVLLAAAAGRIIDRQNWAATPPEPAGRPEAPAGGNPALEGARLVFRSRYLLAIVAIVGLYEVVSQVMDFQFTATVAHYLEGDAIGRHFSTVYAITNITAMVVQLFLTSFIMTRFGLSAALAVLPIAILLGSAGFLVVPILWMGSLLNTTDNGFSYSINQSAKEALYVPTTREEKYKAKAFIDMFVQRFAKVLAIGVSLAITTYFSEFSAVRYLGFFTLAVVVVWLIAVRYAGRRFREVEARST